MKRFWLVLLALGMLFAFSSSVFAADVKFTGSYYVAGMYLDDTVLRKDATGYPATAFYYQRLRVNMEFIATPALKLVTRFDVMERIWGGARTTAGQGSKINIYPPTSNEVASSGTAAENENIAFDLVYIQYASKVGLWRVGYQDDGAWGTVFGDTTVPLPKITYILPYGPFTAIAYIGKFVDNSRSWNSAATFNDGDVDMYVLAGNYTFKGGSAGLLWKYIRQASTRPTLGATQNLHFLLPYVKAQIGPVALQAELIYGFGDYWDAEVGSDVRLDNWAGWVDATADFGMAYVGGTIAYVAGDKPGSAKKEGGVVTGGIDWNPCLIMFNYDLYYWMGPLAGYNSTQMPNTANQSLAKHDGGMLNAWFYQLRGGVRPVADLDIMASLSYAYADQKYVYMRHIPGVLPSSNGVEMAKRDYGIELDVTATYRITNNLTYMLGGAYLWTGDYFKGTNTANKVVDNYLLINKLTLTF